MIRRLFLSLMLAGAALPAPAQDRWLSVEGSGAARAGRLLAVLQVSVAVRDVNARPAMEEAGRVLGRLGGQMQGLAAVDTVAAGPVSVTSLRERPPAPGRQGAYLAEGRLTVTLADPAAVADVTERLLAGGAQAIEAVTYRAADPEGLGRVALERAVDDARRKALGMAAAAGVALGPLLELSGRELHVLGPADGALYAAGTVTLRASVTAVFAVDP